MQALESTDLCQQMVPLYHPKMCNRFIVLLKTKGLFIYRHVSATDNTFLYTECLCVSLVCHNKQREFYYTALSDWLL